MCSSSFTVSQARTEIPLLIAFADLSRFASGSRRRSDLQVAEILDGFYSLVNQHIAKSGGKVVKFIFDAALIIFPENRADEGVRALMALKDRVDKWLKEEGWDSQLIIKAHFGTAVAGGFGLNGDKRFDVVGSAVSQAATLNATSIALSAAAFRKLSSETRRLFKKHTPPITYIPTDAPRP